MAKRRRRIPPPLGKMHGTYDVTTCESGHIHIDICNPGAPPCQVTLAPEEAYDMAEDILRCYDQAVLGLDLY